MNMDPSSAARNAPTESLLNNGPSDSSQIYALLADQLHLQQEQARQQQELLQQLIATLRINQAVQQPQAISPLSSTDSFGTANTNQPVVLRRATTTIFSTVSPAQAVQLLSSQILEFSGIEEENVDLWIQKIEKVSQIHGVSDEITFLAAAGKLTKVARR